MLITSNSPPVVLAVRFSTLLHDFTAAKKRKGWDKGKVAAKFGLFSPPGVGVYIRIPYGLVAPNLRRQWSRCLILRLRH
jgi:hypothetical protein